MTRILLVDDNLEFLEMQSRLLRHAGHDVTTAASGAEALQQAQHSAFGLVIIDIVMPGMDGFETITALRKRTPNLKIIAITGGGRVGSSTPDGSNCLEIARQLGAAGSLTKPVGGRMLLEMVNDVFRTDE